MWRYPTTLHGGISYDVSSATPQASQGGEGAAVQDRQSTTEKSRSPERCAFHHRQPPYPARPLGAAGPLYRPTRGPDRTQGESRHDCSAGVSAFSEDPLNWQKQAIAVKNETRVARARPVFFRSSSLLRRQ